jgi:large subunit ribosomal protein L5
MSTELGFASAVSIFDLYQEESKSVDENNQSVMLNVYKKNLVSRIKSVRGFKNDMQAPRLLKVVLNVGFTSDRKKDIDYVFESIGLLSGQLPKITFASKSISNFKLRAEDPIGVMVTLRSRRMYSFLEKLLLTNIVRTPNFSGFSPKSFDGKGNYSFGIKKHSIFTEEVRNCRVDFDFGIDVTLVTSSSNDEDAKLLLSGLGFIFN